MTARRAKVVVVSGTGTGIGKTHVSAALLGAWRALHPQARLVGLKPVESGVVGDQGDDGRTLEQASTFHVKRFHPPYLLARAVSPHLAARDEGRTVELGPIQAYVEDARALVDGLVVELAGGLFSPLSERHSNLDAAAAVLPFDAHLLVAPDRLGVLHDVAATVRAARAANPAAAPTGIVLVTPEHPDLSTGTNAAELAVVTDVPVVAVVPRATIAACADSLRAAVPS